jgi:hypothetical protein
MRRPESRSWNDRALDETVSVILMVILVIALAAIIGSIVFGLAIFFPKSAYIVVQTEAKNVTPDNWYLLVSHMNGDAAYLNHTLATNEGMPVDFQFTTPTGSTVIPLPDPADGPETWNPGDTLYVYNKSGLIAVTKNETTARKGTGLTVGVWRFDVVDKTDDVLMFTKNIGFGVATPTPTTTGSGYTWQEFFTGPNSSYNLTLYGATWVPGHTENGLFFNGSSYVSIPNSPELAPPSGIRVDTWVKWAIPPGTGNQWANIVTKGDSDGNMQYALQHSQYNDMFEFAVRTTNGRQFVQSNGGLTLQKDTWYHVVGSYNATVGKIELSVNGATPVSRTQTGTFAPGNYDLHIGEGINSNRYFNGIIDDVKVSVL